MIFGRKRLLNNIPELKALAEIHPLAGLSCGNKYYAKTKAGQDVILILGDASAQYRMKEEMRWINYLESCGMPTNRLLDFGAYNSGRGYYMLLSWIPGMDVQKLVHNESPQFCNSIGERSGALLRRIHELPLDSDDSFHLTLSEQVCACIAEYSGDSELLTRFPAMDTFIRFLEDNRSCLIDNSPPKLLHGDYHSKNIIYSKGEISVIDWAYGTTGNPTEDFVRNIISAESNKCYASALINGYYNNNIPEEFWRTLAIYTAIHELRITKYSFVAPRQQISFVEHQHNLVLQEYRGMKTIIPSYYAER